MDTLKNAVVDVRRISEPGRHTFFGYYDVRAFSADDRFHLCHRVGFYDRMPTRDDAAEIGLIDLGTCDISAIDHTTAWCFQQGAMLQWHPAHPDEQIIFNVRISDGYRARITSVSDGSTRELEYPVANVDRSGTYGLSVNFDRMFAFRPGYGYAGGVDAAARVDCPTDDGVFLVDLSTGRGELILSLRDAWELAAPTLGLPNRKVLINHITFNADGTRFLALLRNFPEGGSSWKTALITANRDGSDAYLLRGFDMASHYNWLDRTRLLIWANGSSSQQLYLFDDKTGNEELVDADFFLTDGHCSYSPDEEWIFYDSYPDVESYRHLYLYHRSAKRGVRLASCYSDPKIAGDIRCDLHPRWNSAGTGISFDSIHEGYRAIYTADLSEVMRTLR